MQKSHSETCNEKHAEKTECQTNRTQCVEILFEGASTVIPWDALFLEPEKILVAQNLCNFCYLIGQEGRS